MNETRSGLVGAIQERPVLVGKVDKLALTLREVKSNLALILKSVDRLQLSPPRPVPDSDPKAEQATHSLELRLEEVQISANEVCREAAYLADRLEKLV